MKLLKSDMCIKQEFFWFECSNGRMQAYVGGGG